MGESPHPAADRDRKRARRAERSLGFTIPPRGFTIVEMLAVIGIIGILLSLLLPTVSSIRKEAQSV